MVMFRCGTNICGVSRMVEVMPLTSKVKMLNLVSHAECVTGSPMFALLAGKT
jgi:hypothetical protein